MPKGARSGPVSKVVVSGKAVRRTAAVRGAGVLPPAPDTLDPKQFCDRLMAWYRRHARVLPWRGIQNPYATWLSEIMLQQTRVATVIDRYGEFLQRFPTLQDLAAAPEDDVLALWSGLGYYRRARMLHRGAQFVVEQLGGNLPTRSEDLRTLPGVGEYTAAAVASIAFGESIAVVDGNVERVLLRVLGLPEEKNAGQRALINTAAQSLVPAAGKRPRRAARTQAKPEPHAPQPNPPGDHNQAMMELGATLCLPREPLCLQCPVVALCRTRGEHPTPKRGQPQSRLAAYLLAVRKRGLTTEVLLERRDAAASLMPGMLELPPLPLDAVAAREPVLRLRHGITNTNYQVEIYSEGVSGDAHEAAALYPDSPTDEEQQDLLSDGLFHDGPASGPATAHGEHESVFEAAQSSRSTEEEASLLAEVPAQAKDLHWTPVGRLRELPLTGLARKCLQRLRLMASDVQPKRKA